MTTSHPLTPRAQRAFARTEKAVAAAREDFAAAQSALQKALARGVDVEATLSQATDVLSDVPGTPLPMGFLECNYALLPFLRQVPVGYRGPS